MMRLEEHGWEIKGLYNWGASEGEGSIPKFGKKKLDLGWQM